MPYWIWLICGTALLIVEIFVPHFVVIWFALAALITGIAAYWIDGVAIQLAIFSVSTIVRILFKAPPWAYIFVYAGFCENH